MADEELLLVFTDLDGTLLDHHNYSWEPARPALDRLRTAGVPVILCSSKTVAEQRFLREALHIAHPFLAENGHACAVPAGYFESGGAETGELEVSAVGTPRADVVAELRDLRERYGYRFRGFADLSDTEVAALCGFSPGEAALAKQRIGTEPLHWEDSEENLESLAAMLQMCDMQLVRGGRFIHASGPGDKGTATRDLLQRYQESSGKRRIVTAGLGDSDNDVPLLEAVDHPIVIPRPQGDPVHLHHGITARLAPAPGPAGWNLAMLSLLDELGIG